MKRLLCSMAAVACLAVAGPVAAEAYIPMTGDLIKSAKNPAVYIIDDNLKRHLFPNEATFWTWYSGGWSAQKVRILTDEEFDSFDEDTHVKVRPGSNLIQFDNSNKVYAVTPGGILCDTRALYGADWQSRVIRIQSSFEADYVKDNACVITSDGKLPDGSLIQYVGSKDIWLIDGGKKRKVTAAGFTANGYRDSSIIKNVLTSMTYASDSRSVSALDYNLGVLYSLNYSRSTEITSRPDFIISDIVFPAGRIIVNTPQQIKLIIKNTGGNLTSDAGLKNIVFNGQDWTGTGVSHAGYPTAGAPLQAGQTFEVIYSGKFVAAGSKNFTAKVNFPSEIVEVNGANNSYSEAVTVYPN